MAKERMAGEEAEDAATQQAELAALDEHKATTRESRDIISKIAAHEASVAKDRQSEPVSADFSDGPPTLIERPTPPASPIPKLPLAASAAWTARRDPAPPRWRKPALAGGAAAVLAIVGWLVFGRGTPEPPPAPEPPAQATTPAAPAATEPAVPAAEAEPEPVRASPPRTAPPAKPDPPPRTAEPRLATAPAKKPAAPTPPRAHRHEDPSERPAPPPPTVAEHSPPAAPAEPARPAIDLLPAPPVSPAPAAPPTPPPAAASAPPPAHPAAPVPRPPSSLPRVFVSENGDRLARICQQVESAAIAAGVSADFARNITAQLRRIVRPNTPIYPGAIYSFIVREAAAKRDRAAAAAALAAAQSSGRLRD